MATYAGAIDQGTTSTRFMVFDHGGRVVSIAQKEHEQIFPKPGWVEHDPAEVWSRTEEVVGEALSSAGISKDELAAIGITNQRETAVVWDRTTGKAVYNAIVWQDTRTDQICKRLMADGGQDRFREKTGLPIATYFSGPKVRWILDNVEGVADRADSGELLFGNMDTWVIWNLTGGVNGGLHITDVTNASRTLLMDLATLDWDQELLRRDRRAAGDAARDPRLQRGVRRGAHPGGRGRQGGRRPRRPAGGALRPDLLRGRRGQEHLRHRQLPAAEHRHRGGAVDARPDHDGRLPHRRQAGGLRAGGIDRDHRARWCSGCATTSS